MANLPKPIEQRNELDCRLGIKSSLGDIPSIIALSYVLYCANDKKSEIIYASEQTKLNGQIELKLKHEYSLWITNELSISEDVLSGNPLMTSQIEALQVGLGIMFRLAKLSYVDYPNTDTKERKGGNRYRKLMKFATNMKLLDVFLSSWQEQDLKNELVLWLNNTPSNSALSKGLKQFLTTFSEETQFKIRIQEQEVIFRQNGIYDSISDTDKVVAKDDKEDVGPFRVFKSFVKEGLHPFLTIGNNEFSCNCNDEFENYRNMVETSLNLSPKTIYVYNEIQMNYTSENKMKTKYSLQQIFYGAPGTGKSHATNNVAEMYDTIRTTFHPDSDYSTFVGAYKPTVVKQDRYELNGSTTVALKYPDGDKKDESIQETRIEYKFVKQAFLKAYINAWQLFKDSCQGGKELTPQFLVIEEINRGNCAQIFGDLFQLLDRKNGFSEYPIEADEDIVKALLDKEPDDKLSFGEDGLQLTDEQKAYVDSFFDKTGKPKKNVADKICMGEILVLPPNLYIWATMNTSDQSLFPIDSAFKRRWDWKYMRIKNHPEKGWKIKFKDVDVDWWKFLQAINNKIEYTTKSEDKKLGYFFCKPTQFETTSKPIASIDGNENVKDVAGTVGTQAPNNLFVVEEEKVNDKPTIITAETFVGKVIFYLWNDVFKVSGRKNNIFTIDGKAISFHDFYLEDDANDETNPDNLNLENVAKFITNVMKEGNDIQIANA